MVIVRRAFVTLGWFLCVLSAVEALSWFLPPLREGLLAVRRLFIFGAETTTFRLSGVSLEPSFNAFAILACIPFAWTSASRNTSFYSKILPWLLIGFTLLSGARTAYVGLISIIGFYALLRLVAARLAPAGLAALPVAIIYVAGVLVPILAAQTIDPSLSTSDVTRSYLTAASVEAGVTSFFGQGFGQTTFYVMNSMSSLVQFSWELRDFFYGSRYGELPPLFSWYARTFGEFGIVGYSMLACIAVVSFTKITKLAASHSKNLSTEAAFIALILLAQTAAIGFSIESVRIPQFWMAWTFYYLATTRPLGPNRST